MKSCKLFGIYNSSNVCFQGFCSGLLRRADMREFRCAGNVRICQFVHSIFRLFDAISSFSFNRLS